ncbi:hypothetical protein BKG85_10970 [Mycobacteroides chelonae]|nr:hypothetical protein BKG85_10970 [Mycobacteroides chelonae]
MTELNPSEAQRKAMVDYAIEFDPRLKGVAGFLVDGMFGAANSIPEGAPVGTIARRPDGGYVAVRVLTDYLECYWTYTCTDHVVIDDGWPDADDADSWPVIYDPGEDDAPRLAEAASRPRQFYDPHGMRGSGFMVSADPNQFTVNTSDPTAQQEPETCGVCNGSGVGYGKVSGGLMETDCSDCDATGQAQKESATTHSASPENTNCVPKPREPRVVDRLGVEERDAEWTRTEISRDTYIWEYRYRGGVWKFRLLGHRNWTALRLGDEPANGPFTEVIE